MTLEDVLYVARRMRALDRACITALLGQCDEEAFAIGRYNQDGPAWTVCDEAGEPLLVGGLAFHSAWCCVGWLIATDRMTGQAWRKLVRLARTVLASAADRANEQYKHRIEMHSLCGWRGAEALAERLGFKREGVRRAAGAAGEDVLTWAICGPVRG